MSNLPLDDIPSSVPVSKNLRTDIPDPVETQPLLSGQTSAAISEGTQTGSSRPSSEHVIGGLGDVAYIVQDKLVDQYHRAEQVFDRVSSAADETAMAAKDVIDSTVNAVQIRASALGHALGHQAKGAKMTIAEAVPAMGEGLKRRASAGKDSIADTAAAAKASMMHSYEANKKGLTEAAISVKQVTMDAAGTIKSTTLDAVDSVRGVTMVAADKVVPQVVLAADKVVAAAKAVGHTVSDLVGDAFGSTTEGYTPIPDEAPASKRARPDDGTWEGEGGALRDGASVPSATPTGYTAASMIKVVDAPNAVGPTATLAQGP